MINEKTVKMVNAMFDTMFENRYVPAIGMVSKGISNELPGMVLFMPFENNVRTFHHYLEYSEFFKV
jgi:hypothetical protein